MEGGEKKEKPTDLVTAIDLSHSLFLPACRLVWLCICVSEAAVFVNAFPPPRGWPRKKKEKEGKEAFRQLQSETMASPPAQTSFLGDMTGSSGNTKNAAVEIIS